MKIHTYTVLKFGGIYFTVRKVTFFLAKYWNTQPLFIFFLFSNSSALSEYASMAASDSEIREGKTLQHKIGNKLVH